VFFGGAAFQVTRIGIREWGISLALGVVSIPLGAIIRLIPTAPCERLFKKLKLLPDLELLPMKQNEHWNPAIDRVRDGLWLFANVRRGRMSPQQAQERRNRGKPEIYPNHGMYVPLNLFDFVHRLIAMAARLC
jgi:Ca2+-transporting ATPase